MELKTIKVTVNSKKYTLEVNPLKTLADVLREDLGLTGTKIGCNKGECGACTVIMDGRPVESCLVPAVQADGSSIITIEGLGDDDSGRSDKNLHPIQKAFIEEGAIHCGICTPGFVMSTYAMSKKNNQLSDEEIKEGLSGNLCRCTGYDKIFKASKKSLNKLNKKKIKK